MTPPRPLGPAAEVGTPAPVAPPALFSFEPRLAPGRARLLTFQRCDPLLAVACVRVWHSRLPNVQRGPWMYAFVATFAGEVYSAALWHNPSARGLPHHWIELRRLANAPDSPHNTSSRFLAWTCRWFRMYRGWHGRAISYQDPSVHLGTIYKAAGWSVDVVAKDRVRDRSKPRVGTTRAYRSNQNGIGVDSVGKIRWSIALTDAPNAEATSAQLNK